MDAARKAGLAGEEFVGLDVTPDGKVTKTFDPDGRALTKSLTPKELIDIVNNNKDILLKHHEGFFTDTKMLMSALEDLARQADESGKSITLEEFDDKFQSDELVYGGTCMFDDNCMH